MIYLDTHPFIQITNAYASYIETPHLSTIVISILVSIYSTLLLAEGSYFLICVVFGFSLGILHSYNTSSGLKIKDYERNITYTEQTLEQYSQSFDPPKEVQLFYAPLTTVVNQLLDYVMRDFILSWWNKINVHQDKVFEKLARERLNVVSLNVQNILLNQERNDIVMSTLYGVANTLIIHMRECRAFEESGLSIDEYVVANPQSPFGQLFSKEEQHHELRGLAQTFLKRTLPATDRESLLLLTLFKELLANFVLGNILDHLSDPDFLNRSIVDLLTNKEKKRAIDTTLSDLVTLEIQPTQEGKRQTLSTNESTFLSSLQSPPSPLDATSMIFSPGSVHFTVMDISGHQETPLSKSDLVYLIQIEQPSADAGEGGGGYVITRTYDDFEVFHQLLTTRHPKRTSKIQLKLPLTVTEKSWLMKKKKKDSHPNDNPLIKPADLERYLDKVVQDQEIGTDRTILPFLRKERQAEILADTRSFAEEYRSSPSGHGLDEIEMKGSSAKALSSMDVELLIETTYALVVEMFNLTPANNKAWMRRSILNVLREIVRRSYATFIAERYTDLANAYMSPDAIVGMLNRFGEGMWPEGQWRLGKGKKVRTEEDKDESKRMARNVLVQELIPNAMRQLIGDQNCNLAMHRIWARIQDPDLNRVLILQILERIVKPILG